MNIGLFFGSFNPIHVGHLIIANHIVSNTLLDEVWLVVSPQNPLKKSNSLLNEHHRLHLVQTAIEGESKLRASNVEFKLPKPSYTIDTLTYISEKYPQHQFSVIMGSDSFQNIHNWKNAGLLLRDFKLYIYLRPGFNADPEQPGNIEILHAPLLDISSTSIRKMIRQGTSIRFLVPDNVKLEIEKNNYYGNNLENPA